MYGGSIILFYWLVNRVNGITKKITLIKKRIKGLSFSSLVGSAPIHQFHPHPLSCPLMHATLDAVADCDKGASLFELCKTLKKLNP